MDHGYIFVYLQLPYHLHMWLAIEMLVLVPRGLVTQQNNFVLIHSVINKSESHSFSSQNQKVIYDVELII